MPLAFARLLAIEELRFRGGNRCGVFRAGGARNGDADRGTTSVFAARNSATAADVERGFSFVGWTSGSFMIVFVVVSVGCLRSCASLR